jgi:hypothetical protein
LLLRRLLLFAVLLLPLQLTAQTAADTSTPDPNLIVRGVRLERRDIFDPDERSWFARLANSLHIQTQPAVIRRELLFAVGQPYDSALVAESERNLRAIGVFRRVKIDSVRTPDGLFLRVTTKDGWSTQADWRFRSTGGDVAFTIGLVESNLLGTASAAAIRYRQDPDRSSVALSFRRPRLFVGSMGLGVGYENKSDGHSAGITLDNPFYSLTSRRAFRFDAGDGEERVLQFRNGGDVASDTLQRRYTLVRVAAAKALRASTAGYLRLGLGAHVRRDDFVPEGFTGPFPETITGVVGVNLEVSRSRFIVTQGYAGFAREEDVDLGTTMRVGLSAAPKLFGYERNGIGPDIGGRVGARIPGGFAFLDAGAHGLFTAAGLDSGSVQIAGTTVLQPARRHMAVFHAEAGWLESPAPGAEFDLGLGSGPRAFGSHAFTGDRAVFVSAEYRYTVMEDLFRLVSLGIAGFVDHGGAWYAGSPTRTGSDAGIGLRLGASRSSDTDALRFDLAYRFANDVDAAGWVLIVGKGFAFSSANRRAS